MKCNVGVKNIETRVQKKRTCGKGKTDNEKKFQPARGGETTGKR